MLTLLASGLRRGVRYIALILLGRHSFGRVALLRLYVPMLFRQALSLARPGVAGSGGVARILGHDMRYAAFVDLVYSFEETFIREQYRFDPATETPRILDCGSNVGLSILYFKLVCPGARIVAFEPSPEVHALLVENVSGFAGVTVEQKALGAVAGEVPFYASPFGRLGASTFRHGEEEPLAIVEAVPLSRYVESGVDLLKLDVEGREQQILEELASSGALHSIRQVIVEVHTDPEYVDNTPAGVRAVLESAGFACAIREGEVADYGNLLLCAVQTAPAG